MSTALRLADSGTEYGFCGMIGRHPRMLELFDRIERAARESLPVLIVGETGTGKELVAQALHGRSELRGPLVPLNVAMLSDHLAEAELFGTVRGAFTGAVDRPGLIETASGGTLFLDEASELPLGTQARLLRALECHAVRRVGGRQERQVRFRLLLSLQRPAAALVAGGKWREDFCHRVNGITLHLPPLRERPEDVPPLLNFALGRLGRPSLPAEHLRALMAYTWPGNVRELIRVVGRASFVAGEGPVSLEVLEAEIGSLAATREPDGQSLNEAVRDVARASIQRALSAADNDKMVAAAALGLSVHQLYRRIKALGMTVPRSR
jgi:transcriptional regulator with PAS, ATPase and Fis domain